MTLIVIAAAVIVVVVMLRPHLQVRIAQTRYLLMDCMRTICSALPITITPLAEHTTWQTALHFATMYFPWPITEPIVYLAMSMTFNAWHR